ncbi:MAG: GNAT family N-acetyltransferase [Alphaproteobacteria bacterium]|nr:GNAT family N-acetyltransferase [Alphaproteobacteria bacterium]
MKDISFILTVYNKEKVLPFVIQSLFDQEEVYNAEYIFIDDASTDKSVEVIKQKTTALQMRDVKIVLNKEKLGPSIRLNQALEMAKGQVLFVMDGDDILPQNAIYQMQKTMYESKADIVRGKPKRSGLIPEELLGKKMKVQKKYFLTDNPLSTVLTRKDLTGLCVLFKKSILEKSSYFEEGLFTHDVAFMLKIAAASKSMVLMKEPTFFVPFIPDEVLLSKDYRQVLYDGFFARYNFFESIPMNSEEEKVILKRLLEAGYNYIYYASLRPKKPITSLFEKTVTRIRKKLFLPKLDRFLFLYIMGFYFGLDARKAVKSFALYIKKDMRRLRGKLRKEDVKISPLVSKDAQEVKFYLQQVTNETKFLASQSLEWLVDTKYLASLYDTITPEEGVFLKAVVKGKIVGICSLRRPVKKRVQHNAELSLSVLKAYWGRSIGTYLLMEAILFAKKNGIKRVQVYVNTRNKRALEIFKRFGFVYEGLLKKTIRIGNKYYDAYLMTLFLS